MMTQSTSQRQRHGAQRSGWQPISYVWRCAVRSQCDSGLILVGETPFFFVKAQNDQNCPVFNRLLR